jgi:hypothetical protein
MESNTSIASNFETGSAVVLSRTQKKLLQRMMKQLIMQEKFVYFCNFIHEEFVGDFTKIQGYHISVYPPFHVWEQQLPAVSLLHRYAIRFVRQENMQTTV